MIEFKKIIYDIFEESLQKNQRNALIGLILILNNDLHLSYQQIIEILNLAQLANLAGVWSILSFEQKQGLIEQIIRFDKSSEIKKQKHLDT